MKISSIRVAKSVLRNSPLGDVMLCLVCVLALLSANELRVHAGQWSPSVSTVVNTGNLSAGSNLESHANPEATRQLLIAGNPPELGSSKAPVTIVEFADFQCGYCKKMNDLLENQLLPAESDKVKIVYRYFPLPQHSWARPAAQMAACVQMQDREAFWKLHDFFYASQDSFSISSIRTQVEDFLAKQTPVNVKTFDGCMDSNAGGDRVESDMQMAASLGVHATPTLFVNGLRLNDAHELQQLEDAVNAAMKDEAAANRTN